MTKRYVNPIAAGCFLISLAVAVVAPDSQAVGLQITPRPWYRHYDRYEYGNDWRYGKPSDYDAYYNFKVGELSLAMTGRLAAQWSDNNNRAGSAGTKEEGWSLIPELTVGVNYPVSPYLNINFSVSAGYRYYFNSQAGENGFFVSGDSDVAAAETGATFILGEDHYITFHDRLTFESDTLATNTYANTDPDNTTAEAESWRNVASLTYARNLNPDWRTELMYAYEIRRSQEDDFEYQSFDKHSFDWNLWWQMLRNVETGPYFTFSRYIFDTGERNDRETYELGVTANIEDAFGLENLSLSINGGWEILNSDTNDFADDDDDGPTANFTIYYEPEGALGHRVRTSYRRNHEDPNPLVNYADELLLGYGIDIKATDDLIFTADVDWLDINESDQGEHYNLIRFWVTTTYWITPDTSCDVSYWFTEKYRSSNDYRKNTVEIGVTHRF
ncbi:MAG: hypothetical protein RRC34_11555 [Lentisphaeria bacterium]|nr:hypothetical protein [Lentisphaeria bacterium]